MQESCKKEGKGSCRTISPKNEADVEKCEGKVGKQQKLSVRDVEKINKYYDCSGEGIYEHYELTNDIRCH